MTDFKTLLRRVPLVQIGVIFLVLAIVTVWGYDRQTRPRRENIAVPRIIAQNPFPGEELAVDGNVEVSFSLPMNQPSVEKGLRITPETPFHTEWSDSATLRIIPDEELRRDTEYSIILGPAATDANGYRLDGANSVDIQTQGYLRVTEMIPERSADEVSTDAVITVMFNRPVVDLLAGLQDDPLHPLTFEPDIPGSGEWVNTSIYVWRPQQLLPGGQEYRVHVIPDLQDVSGATLDRTYAWSFSTVGPQIVSIAPAGTDSRYPPNTPVRVEFNQPMDTASVERAFRLYARDEEPVEGEFSWEEEDRLMVFQPEASLEPGMRYTVEIVDGATNASRRGNLEAGTFASEFDTADLPRVLSTTPSDGESDVSIYGDYSGLAHIKFNTAMDAESLREEGRITITPEPEMVWSTSYWGEVLHLSGRGEPHTTYTITLNPGARDVYGNTIDEPYTFSFTTASAHPQLQLNQNEFFGMYDAGNPTQIVLVTRNIDEAAFKLYRIPDEVIDEVVVHDSYRWGMGPDLPGEAELMREWIVRPQGPQDEVLVEPVPVARGGGALEPGVYRLDVSYTGVYSPWDDSTSPLTRTHYLFVSNANLTFKNSGSQTFGWLTDLQTGKPIEGARVTFFGRRDNDGDPMGAIGWGRTDEDGTVYVETPRQESDSYYYYGMRAYAMVNDGNTFAIALSGWSNGIRPYNFGVDTDFYPETETLYLHTDRPLYRPGDEVFFRAILRDKDDMLFSPPDVERVSVRVSDLWYAGGEETIYAEALDVSETGIIEGRFTLPDDVELRRYYFIVETGTDHYGYYYRWYDGYFDVAEFRKPEIEVELTADEENVLDEGTVNVTVSANYFFGAPAENARVEWNVYETWNNFSLDTGQYYRFIDTTRYWNYLLDDFASFDSYNFPLKTGEGVTDSNGNLTLSVPVDIQEDVGSRRFTIEATVTDSSGLPVTGRTDVIVHNSQYYVGVRWGTFFGTAGKPQDAHLIVVDWEGNPVPNQEVRAELVRQTWSSQRVYDEYGNEDWEWRVDEEPVGQPVTVTTGGGGVATAQLTPPSGGSFKVRATVFDPAGNSSVSSSFLWVGSSSFQRWRRSSGVNNQIDIVSDKPTYLPGETAEILITSPFEGEVQALVTVERGDVMSHEVITFSGGAYTYRLPVTSDHVPNVYVSVVLIKGVDDTNAVPDFRMGLTAFDVEPVEQLINVTVTPDEDTIAPGESVRFTVETTDHEGNPVEAEVSLALVDAALLSLTEPNTISLKDHFYQRQGLSVETAVPLVALIDRQIFELIPDLTLEAGGGGGGGGGPALAEIDTALRENFEDTAYWRANLRTGPDGRASVVVPMPDNLTTWRMDARAITEDTRVGQSETEIVATLPLLIRPVTPRFFVVDDHVSLAAVVNNNTDEDLEAVARLDAEGVSLESDPTQRITVLANGRMRVEWPVIVEEDAEWVDAIFSVQGGGYTDAARPEIGDAGHDRLIPVYRYEGIPGASEFIVATAGMLAGPGTRVEGLNLPGTVDTSKGEVRIQVDPSLASTTLDGLTWLTHFPHECNEQLTSRFLPNALTLTALRQFGLDDPQLEKNLEEQIAVGLEMIYERQNKDGGWGWWPGDQSDPLTSAYILQGMITVREAGIGVDRGALADAERYVTNQIKDMDAFSETWELNRNAYLLYVVARHNALQDEWDDPRYVEWQDGLYELRYRLHDYAKALLTQTIWLQNPDDPRLASLQSDLVNAATLTSTGAYWHEGAQDYWNWSTDIRSTAVILDTFAQVWPEHDLNPNVVRWLMTVRSENNWHTTQETAWSLMGLTHWMVASGELNADYLWQLTLNDETLKTGEANSETLADSTVVKLELDELLADRPNELAFARSRGDGNLYYSAQVTGQQQISQLGPISHGIAASRRYLNEEGEPVTEGRVGEVLTVELTVVVPEELHYAYIEDFYPSGVEPVNPGLLSESLFNNRPVLRDENPLFRGWGWWWFSHIQLQDERAVLSARQLPAGTYLFTYQIRLSVPGSFNVLPPEAREFYSSETYGRGAGTQFTIHPEEA